MPRSLENNWVTRAKLLDKRVETNTETQLLFIGVMAVMHNLRRGAAPDAATPSPLSAQERTAWSLRYFGLCFFLGACVYLANRLLHPAGI